MTYTLEADIPFPADLPFRAPPRKFPLDTMEVGESFLAPLAEDNALRIAIAKRHKRGDRGFVTRRDGSGLRCWRIV